MSIMKDMTQEQMRAYMAAIEALEEWPKLRQDQRAERDRRIRQAHEAGVSQPDIATRMKVGRNTVSAVLGSNEEGC